MNPHAVRSLTPISLLTVLFRNWDLLSGLTKREILSRYRGSTMGLLWSLFLPLLMLAVYTFVFSVIFQARWSVGSGSKTEFALVLFSGLMVYNLFSECIIRAPGLVVSNASYVKKVIFPLEVLPLVVVGAAIFQFAASFIVWLLFYILLLGPPKVEILLLPLVLLPLVLMTMGITWLLASLGVYLRDIAQVVGVVTTILMFMSPIFYPVSALPDNYRLIVQLSPITAVIEQARAVMLWGDSIRWVSWLIQLGMSMFIAWLGLAWFQKTRKGFADVI